MLAPEVWRVAQRWVRKAESDLRNIALVLPATDAPLDTVCFHAQQAAEKYLKALLVCYGVPFGRTHDLSVLLDKLPATSKVSSRVGDLDELSQAAVEARYPGSAERCSASRAERDI